MDTHTPVLIAGGSLTGLSLALFLSDQGVPCTVVEREPGHSAQFRASGVHARTMEIFRAAGIEDDVRAAGTDKEQSGGVARVRNLADTAPQWLKLPWDGDAHLLSPCSFCMCPQDRLEPVLWRHARARGADVRFNTELRSFRHDDNGVSAVVTDRTTGTEYTVYADYLVGADGAHGRVREQLGISRDGPGILEHWASIIFRCDLQPVLDGNRFRSAFITDLNGSLVPRAPIGLWQLALIYQPDADERLEDTVNRRFTQQHCTELIRTAAAQPDLDVTIVDVMPWQASAYLADGFRDGRVFLAGDAAHVMPPTGAFGGNTAIHDAHNLAWKLATVLRGAAGAGLLDTYETERRPVAEATLAEALMRMRSWFATHGKDKSAGPQTDDNTVMLGYRYRSPAVLGDDSTGGAGQDVFTDPRSAPAPAGARAPHILLERDDHTVSTLDILGRGFTLLTGPDGAPWCDAAHDMAGQGRVSIECHQIGPGQPLRDPQEQWAARYGIGTDGAVLVRPDGFIAWRSQGAAGDPAATLRSIMDQMLA
jgi:putative polyketide hydroxylase